MAVVEFRKRYFDFYDIFNIVSIANSSQKKVSVVDVINIRTHSCETNKLRNIYTIRRV